MVQSRTGVLVAATLVALAGAGCAVTRPAAASNGIVSGLVLSGPRCPGPARAEQPCPPGPVDGAVVAALAGGRQVASSTTRADGRFSMTLPAGRYLIRATNIGGYASTADQLVSVTRAQTVTVTLVLDTGIR